MPSFPSAWSLYAIWILLSAHVSAFYPYLPFYLKGDSPDQRRGIPTQERTLSLPLHRVPVRRENTYKIVSAITPTKSDSVGIDQDGADFTYFSSMTFGSSNVQFHMLMDTAASNTWVMSSDCTTDVCKKHNLLGKDVSSSLVINQDKTFQITYGTGNVNGTTASDKATFGGNTVDLTFGLASGVSNDFGNYPLDGILGFGRGSSDSNGVNAPSIIDVLSSKSLIQSKLIGVHLARAKDGTNDGQLNLGFANDDFYDGDLAYIDAMDNSRGFWELPIDDAGAGGNMAGLKGQTAILDTGTSYVLIPPAAAATLLAQVEGSSKSGDQFTVPCSTTVSIQIVLGGKTYEISPKDYVGVEAGNGACYSTIIGRQTFDDNQWLMGDVFLKNVYTVFDFDGKRIGLGVKGAESSQSESTTTSASSSGMPAISLPSTQVQAATRSTEAVSLPAAPSSASAEASGSSSNAKSSAASATSSSDATTAAIGSAASQTATSLVTITTGQPSSSPIIPDSPVESGSTTQPETQGTATGAQASHTSSSLASSVDGPSFQFMALLAAFGGIAAFV